MYFDACNQAINIQEVRDGIDFYFANRQGSIKLVDFVSGIAPIKCVVTSLFLSCWSCINNTSRNVGVKCTHASPDRLLCSPATGRNRTKTSERLISGDEHTGKAKMKWTFSTEIAPVCKVRQAIAALHSHVCGSSRGWTVSQDDLVCLPRRLAANLGGIG